MSKVSTYLQQHVSGEVVTDTATRRALARDASVLEITPEMVIYPRVTNDIRKVARFAWQLAEKGHVLPLTVRGGGNDETGGAIGKGVIIAQTFATGAPRRCSPMCWMTLGGLQRRGRARVHCTPVRNSTAAHGESDDRFLPTRLMTCSVR